MSHDPHEPLQPTPYEPVPSAPSKPVEQSDPVDSFQPILSDQSVDATDGSVTDGADGSVPDGADGSVPDGADGSVPDGADGSVPDGEDDDDLARSALAGARGSTRAAGGRRNTARRRRRPDEPGRNRGGYSAPGPDPARDPQRLGELLPGYVADLGWEQPMADARVFAQWSMLVGADVAAHCEPQSLRDGELRVTAESTAWATQLRLLAGTLLARLVAELGPHVVTRLVISGPVAPSWKHGPRSVRGARGPRDTYG